MKNLIPFSASFFLITGLVFAQEKKLALIIGNSMYSRSPLANTVNDARDMDAMLTGLGFVTLRYENLNLNELKKAIDGFGKQLHSYDVGLFYYAGHGIQYKGRNYLIPVNADLQIEQLIELDCVPVDRVLAFMENSGTDINLLILDACRNNPFERSWNRSITGNGLAFMNAPSGSLIAYATAPGSVASDGSGSNGLYTSILLKHIATPDITVEQVFKRVRSEIEIETKKRQVPWESTSLKGDFYFNTDQPAIELSQNSKTTASENAAMRDLNPIKKHTVRIQAEMPVLVGVGYGYHFTRHISVDVQTGMLSRPNNFFLLDRMGSSGNEDLNLMIKNAFTSGRVYEAGVDYHFKNNYLGIFSQSIRMKGAAATSQVEQTFNTDVSTLPVKNSRTEVEPASIDLASDLLQVGLLFGRIIPLKNPHWQFRLEFSISKNIASTSTLASSDRDLSTLQGEVDRHMDAWFSDYGYVPSLTFAVAHAFGKRAR